MGTEAPAPTRIGETAGMIWRYLASTGPVRVARLVREVSAPRDLLMQAIGWLAREDKIGISKDRRGRTISLKNV